MSAADERSEVDHRFPSGEWTGFFLQPDSRRRYGMELFLKFRDSSISGGGSDAIANFSMTGDYDVDAGRCLIVKQYLGAHRVLYTGCAACGGIVGRWQIPGNPPSWTGPFFLWPKAAGNLSERFEEAYLDFELPAQRSRPVEELVEV